MNREAARLIKRLSKISEKSERSLKREYYSFDSKKRFQMKKEIKKFLRENKLVNEQNSI